MIPITVSAETLMKKELLSKRGFNICRRISRTTLDDIVSTGADCLSASSSCGPKTLLEIAHLKDWYRSSPLFTPDQKNRIPEISWLSDDMPAVYLEMKDEEIYNAIHEVFLQTADQFGYPFDEKRSDYYHRLLAFYSCGLLPENEFNDLMNAVYDSCPEHKRGALLHILKQVASLDIIASDLRSFIASKVEIRNLREFNRSALTLIQCLTPDMYAVAAYELKKRFDVLSVRTRHIFSFASTLDGLMEYRYGRKSRSLSSIRGAGGRSVAELRSMIADFSMWYTQEISPWLRRDTDEEIRDRDMYFRRYRIAVEFPFLSDEERDSLLNTESRTGEFPIFDVLYSLIGTSTTVRDKVAVMELDLYGDYGSPLSKKEIAERLGITASRVGQLGMLPLQLPPVLESHLASLAIQLEKAVVASDDAIWTHIDSVNTIPMSRIMRMGLVRNLFPEFTLEVFEDCGLAFLVRRAALSDIRLRMVISELRRICQSQRVAEEKIDLLTLLAENETALPASDENLALAAILKRFASIYAQCRDESASEITLLPNRIDIIREIERILEENGRIMSISELKEKYDSRFPQEPVERVSSFRNYIQRSSRIVPKGRTGHYILREWDGYFKGNITGFITKLLADSEDPMTVAQIHQAALAEFPSTTEKSITSLLYLGRNDRFAIFPDLKNGTTRYGLKKNYESYKAPSDNATVIQASNSEKYRMYEQFVEQNGYFPTSHSSTSEEQLLYRWAYHLERRRQESGEWADRLAALRMLYPDYPQTGRERRFRDRVDAVVSNISSRTSLPTRFSSSPDYTFLHKYCQDYSSLEGNRLRWFTNLVKLIRDRFPEARDIEWLWIPLRDN